MPNSHDPFGENFREFRPATDGEGVEPVPSKYPPAEFVVPASDGKGRSARVQCKITPFFARFVSEAVQCRKFGFRTESDVVRWCVKFGLERLKELEPTYAPFMMRAQGELEIIRYNMMRAQQEEVIAELDKLVRLCMEKGEISEAQKMIKGAWDRFYNSEDDIWRKRILSLIKEKFTHVMTRAPEIDRRKDPWEVG